MSCMRSVIHINVQHCKFDKKEIVLNDMHPFHDQCIRITTDTQNCATPFVLRIVFVRDNTLQEVYVSLKVLAEPGRPLRCCNSNRVLKMKCRNIVAAVLVSVVGGGTVAGAEG